MKRLFIFIACLLTLNSIHAQQTRAAEYSTLYNEGVQEVGKKEYSKALLLFNQALQLKPDYNEALFARGQCFLMLNERDKACVDFATSYKAGWEPAKEYIEKYCAKNAPGRTRKPLNVSGGEQK